MPDKKFHVGDSVWFSFINYDNRKREQKGHIKGFDYRNNVYLIVGNTDHKLYKVHEEDISYIPPDIRNKIYQVNTWVYFKGPNNIYYHGVIKDYDPKDHLYKIEYISGGYGAKIGYVFEREILDFKFKCGEEVEFRFIRADWKRGKIQQCYADKDGQIFYDIYLWDEKLGDYDSLRAYREIMEEKVRSLDLSPGFKGGKISWECKDSIPVQFSTDGVYLKELVPTLQPKFKVGDKIIFTGGSDENNIRGTITKILEKNIDYGDYVVKEHDSNSFWRVWEKDITGFWDECSISMSTDDAYFKEKLQLSTEIQQYLVDDVIAISNVYKKSRKECKIMHQNNKLADKSLNPILFQRPGRHWIKNVIFDNTATIVITENDSNKEHKTVVKTQGDDKYDPSTGFLLALLKNILEKESYDTILRILDEIEGCETEDAESLLDKLGESLADKLGKLFI